MLKGVKSSRKEICHLDGVTPCSEMGKSDQPPVWELDIDRDGKKDVIIIDRDGTAQVYISLRYVLAIAAGVLLTVTGYMFDMIPGL